MNIVRLQGSIEKRTGVYYEYDVDSKPLGEGGMGRVFKGYRVVERTGERMPVAIKAIYEYIPERVVERARREANIQLDNDNLIRMYGFVETITQLEGEANPKVRYHVIMELLIGVTLGNIMNGITSDQNGMQIPFAVEMYNQYTQYRDAAVVKIMKSILSGLMALHDNGFIHRDIDPSNIMLTIDGKIKLIDLGICKNVVSLDTLDKPLTSTGAFIGKVNYAAPETALGDIKSQHFTTDIYSMGIVLFQLCTGHLPFSGSDDEIRQATIRKKIPLKEISHKGFRKIIKKATAKDQAKRYSSVAEFRVDLERLALSYDSHGQLLTIGCVILGGILCGGLGFYMMQGFRQSLPPPPPVETVEELYAESLNLLERKDSASLYGKGRELQQILAEDSLYEPAMLDYYIYLTNHKDVHIVRTGLEGLMKLADEYQNATAMFECGLTYSRSNRNFEIPEQRQSLLGIEMDLMRANEWLYKAMDIDSLNYKPVYWAFNNLMDLKLNNGLPEDEDYKLVELFREFESRVENFNDTIALRYKNAIENDKTTLQNWGLLH